MSRPKSLKEILLVINIIGENAKYLSHKYGIPQEAFKSNLQYMFKKINSYNRPSNHIPYIQQVANQVIELLTSTNPILSNDDVSFIIDELCTKRSHTINTHQA